jgi:hypothetical protein
VVAPCTTFLFYYSRKTAVTVYLSENPTGPLAPIATAVALFNSVFFIEKLLYLPVH